MYEILERAERDAAWRLRSDPGLAGRTVLLEREDGRKRTLIAALEAADGGGKRGAVLLVRMARFDVDVNTVSGPQGQIRVAVRALVARSLAAGEDGVAQSADALAMQALHNLHRLYSNKPLLAEQRAAQPFLDWLEDDVLGADIALSRGGGMSGGDKVQIPAIASVAAPGGFTVTLTCPTVGATIYHAEDGSYPASANPEATAYAAPFFVPAGTFLRVGAQLDPLIPSDPAEKQL